MWSKTKNVGLMLFFKNCRGRTCDGAKFKAQPPESRTCLQWRNGCEAEQQRAAQEDQSWCADIWNRWASCLTALTFELFWHRWFLMWKYSSCGPHRHQSAGTDRPGQTSVQLRGDCGGRLQQAWSSGLEEGISGWHPDTGKYEGHCTEHWFYSPCS